MITVSKLSSLLDEIVLKFPAIREQIMCVHEGHMTAKLQDKSGIILGCIYPSANRTGSINQAYDENVTWVWILEKDIVGQNNTDELLQMQKLQELILNIRDYLEEVSATTHCYLQKLETSKSQIIPEHREFGGWNGWSLSLVF